jgi:TRAP-type C4-dicarboxylate transport system permease small subunit
MLRKKPGREQGEENGVIAKIERVLARFLDAMGIVSAAVMILLMLYVAADAIMRNLNHSFVGSNELVVNVIVVVVFLALGRTSVRNAQIKIDVFTFLPSLDFITLTLTLVAYIVAGVAAFDQANLAYQMKLSSSFLNIPRWPFLVVTGFGLILCGVGALCVEMRAISQRIDMRRKRKLGISDADMEVQK